MMTTYRWVSTKLNVSISLPSDDHSVSFFKRDKVINFRFFIIIFVDRIEYNIWFFEFWKLYEIIRLVIQLYWIRHFCLTKLTFQTLPVYLRNLINSDRIQLGCKPLLQTMKMSVLWTANTVTYCQQGILILSLLHTNSAF